MRNEKEFDQMCICYHPTCRVADRICNGIFGKFLDQSAEVLPGFGLAVLIEISFGILMGQQESKKVYYLLTKIVTPILGTVRPRQGLP